MCDACKLAQLVTHENIVQTSLIEDLLYAKKSSHHIRNNFYSLPKLLWQMDEPIADSAFITTFLVAEFAL